MRITAIDTWVVNVPLRVSFASSFETKAGTTRTVIRVTTDDGHVGWGETMHGRPTQAIVDRIKDGFLGLDPRATAEVTRRSHMVPFFHGYLGYCAIAGVEMALFDLVGKATGTPFHLMLGGAATDEIPITALLTRGDAPDATRAELPRALAAAASTMVAEGGFRSLKFKGSSDARFDVAVMRELRSALPETGLRVDPNAAWSVPESLWAARELEELGLEYLEDPCAGLEGMARVAEVTTTPLCTNMCVVRLEDFAPAVRSNAVQVVHADPHKWGGIHASVAMHAVCRAFGLGVGLHSGGELGISMACDLGLAAALGIDYPADAMYYLLVEDVVTGPLSISGGAIAVPQGPGLGVDVDLEKLGEFAERNRREGDHTL
ncbi:MAG: isomerase [Candidatus Dormibacteraeota bacterium]|nr:isomerase [Candidatus Dormibacteraeota bacterium]